ncbi:MAG: methyl-accepting chemotaxis protein [Salipiger marinus]|uniref:methyl-accepting chemotaxis protein n=1 Tax=Salipiger marinus TaxID=555512 RepID=UPI0040580E6B
MASQIKAPRLRSHLASVFFRVALLLAASTLAVAAVMAWQSWRIADRVAKDGVAETAQKATEAAAISLVQPLRFMDAPRAQLLLSDALLSGGENSVAGLVIGADGAPVAEGGDVDLDRGVLLELAAAALASNSRVEAEDGHLIAVPVPTADPAVAGGALVMSWSDDAVIAAIFSRKMQMLATAAVTFAVMMVLTMLAMRRFVTQPLRQVDQAMSRIAAGDYDTEVPMRTRRDEFGGLARHLADLTVALADGRAAAESRSAAHEAQNLVVQHLSDGLDRLAAGVLSRGIDQRFPEEYEGLRANYNRAVSSLRDALSNVRAGAMNIHSSAEEMARASDDLSHRTETQAATLEETAAALEQMLSSVRQAAGSAQEVESTVRTASQLADQNGSVMRSAVEAMAGIEKSSEQISEIIGVIDDIAFQTNLLALNAGVEAARAGASGKGFAVVASEVRALAQRSSDAAQQIKALISGSAEQVKDGVELVERAGQALSQVVEKVGQISGLVSGIANVSQEQALGLNEINLGVSNLDRVTQQNAAMVEESTAAVHMLRSDAGKLSELTESFEIGEEQGQSAQASGLHRAA